MTPPVRGGQGRAPQYVLDDAAVVFWWGLLFVALLASILLFGD